MQKLRVLLTNNTLSQRYGTELYIRDIALALLARGHTPIAFSTLLGDVANELRRASIPVIDDLSLLSSPPDIIHGHHHLETMIALLHFPQTPAINFCHGWLPWEERPPLHPRILRYLAVDDVCKDRLTCENPIPESRVRVLLNFVDLNRFRQRSPLPQHPQRALVFSNYATESAELATVRACCAEAGIKLDVIGEGVGIICSAPEEVLGNYDLIFARGRSALEAIATGAAVILLGSDVMGPMVTSANLEQLRRLNLGIRTLTMPLSNDTLNQEIARYDSADATAVTARIRSNASRENVVDELIEIYRAVISEHAANPNFDPITELHSTSNYLRQIAPRLKGQDQYRNNLEDERDNYKRELDWIKNSALFRFRQHLVSLPLLARIWRTMH